MKIGHTSPWGVHLCVIQPAVSLLAFVPLSLYFEGSRGRESRVKWRGGGGGLVACAGEGGRDDKGDAFRVADLIKHLFFLYLIKQKGGRWRVSVTEGQRGEGGREEGRTQWEADRSVLSVRPALTSSALHNSIKSYHLNLIVSICLSPCQGEFFSLPVSLWLLSLAPVLCGSPLHVLILSECWFIPSSPECHWKEPFGSTD